MNENSLFVQEMIFCQVMLNKNGSFVQETAIFLAELNKNGEFVQETYAGRENEGRGGRIFEGECLDNKKI